MSCSVSFVSSLTILTIVEGKAPIFRTDAAFFTEAGFKKVIRGGEVERVFWGANRGRQPGIDGLPDDLLTALPLEMARLWHPLLVKVGARLSGAFHLQGQQVCGHLQGQR